MIDCLFCKIVEKTLPADIVWEDDEFIAIKDLYPKATLHWLLIPKLHIDDLTKLTTEHDPMMARALRLLPMLAKKAGVAGFRTIINTGKEGGQEIFHIHFHLLAGSKLPGF